MPFRADPRKTLAALAVLALPALAACAPGQQFSGLSVTAPGKPRAENPDSLVGSDGDLLEERLGRPDYLRAEDTAEVWQYRLDNCVVDFVLYRNGAGYRIAGWNGRHRVSGRDYDHDTCRRELRRRRAH